MTVITEPVYLTDLLYYEVKDLWYSRESVIIAAGQNLSIGSVVGKKTADGKYLAWDPSATDGTEIAVGVLLESVDATSGEKRGLIVARQAIVGKKYLVFKTGVTEEQKLTAYAQLEQRGILVRDAF